MINEVTKLQSVENFASLLKGVEKAQATGIKIGKTHYALIGGSNKVRFVLWEKIPAELAEMGYVEEGVDPESVVLHYQEEGDVSGSRLAVEVPDPDTGNTKLVSAVVEAGDDARKKSAAKAPFFSAAFRGKPVPLDPVEDFKPLAGIPGTEMATISLSDEVTCECNEVTVVLGSGAKICSFDLPLQFLKLAQRKAVKSVKISLEEKLPLVNFDCGDFGVCYLVHNFELLQPTTLKDALDELKQMVLDFEDIQKTNVLNLKSAISAQEVALREHKKAFNEGLRTALKLASDVGDPKKIKSLEDKLTKKDDEIKSGKDEIKKLKDELKAFEKLRAAAEALK